MILFLVAVFGFTNFAVAGDKEIEKEIKISTIKIDDNTNKPFLGVYLADLDNDEREALDYKGKDGILIEDVVDDGAAEKAGIESGDILIELGGKKIESIKGLRKILTKKKPGDEIKAIVFQIRTMGEIDDKVYLILRNREDDRGTLQ